MTELCLNTIRSELVDFTFECQRAFSHEGHHCMALVDDSVVIVVRW